ncbi:MAG TPA: sigma-70 family RNA polymerase sigma factor [Fimbriimonas sp.]
MSTNSFRLTPGDERRFNELMEETYKKVFNMAYRLSGNRSDAEDLTQEAFYRAYRSFADYEGDRPFENWIFRIVTRLFLDLLRNRRRRVKAVSYDSPLPNQGGDESLYFDMPDEAPNPEQRMLENSFSEDLQKAMNSLSPEQRLLVTLADIEGMPYKDIADMLDKPVGTIRSRLHRTHKLLRARLEQVRREGQAPTTAKRGALRLASSY